jgi:Glyoxalase/Bleomycin resistance protein/Dioxygenase superfamily
MSISTPLVALPGPIRQIGFVVNDLDKALESWVALGVGPWYVIRGQHLHTLYRGKPCEVTLTIALANSGDMQLEVITQEAGDPSIYTEFLSGGREGFNQFAYWATDFDAAVQSAQDAGWPVVWSGGETEGVRYAYVEPSGGPAPIIEISELNDATTGLGDFLRAAADGWDGTDPIRSLLGR